MTTQNTTTTKRIGQQRLELGLLVRRKWFPWTMGAFALLVCTLVVVILWQLVTNSQAVWERWGLEFLTRTQWNPVSGEFGALAFIVGTILTSTMALLMAVPIALGIAILLSEYMSRTFREPLIFIVELLAAIPSVVYGLWGIFVLAPWLYTYVIPVIANSPLGLLPVFGEPGPVYNMFTASVILAVMILPIIASLSREVLLAVPVDQKEAALALGCTRWEAVKKVVLPYGRSGLMSAAILGLARALGETMAVTMVIGNRVWVNFDVFQEGYSMPAIIANEFREAATRMHVEALVAVGLVLFAFSFVVNAIGRFIVSRYKHKGGTNS
jgi:phosphate transport system permease protein